MVLSAAGIAQSSGQVTAFRGVYLTAASRRATLHRMFTGLVQSVGRVVGCDDGLGGKRLVIDAGAWSHHPRHGDSIAVNGCCLTVAERAGDARLAFDVVQRTLDATTLGALAAGDRVNLEHAATPATMLGGHIVQGHIDGIGTVSRVMNCSEDCRVWFDVPAALRECVIETGSIAVNGVSLTVAELTDSGFGIALIPTTLRETNLSDLAEGDQVNIETDYVAKTVVHWLRLQRKRFTTEIAEGAAGG